MPETQPALPPEVIAYIGGPTGESLQFDFLIGEWRIEGRRLGRTYSPGTRRWEMAGLPALQPAMNGKWFGNLVGDEMHLEAEGVRPDGREVRSRIRFFAIGPDRFEWENLVCPEGESDWVRIASLVATRA